MTADQAKARFFMLAAVRFAGLAIALVGVTIVARKWVEPADIIGFALIIAGAVDMIVVPPLLVRAWKRADT